jgi:hypothetical protein
MEIKQGFPVQLKILWIDHNFWLFQTPKKYFPKKKKKKNTYVETNEI